MKKETKILVGVLAGAALGATIALVLSTDGKGELKEKVSDWLCDFLDSSKDKLANLKDKATSAAERVKDNALSSAERVKDHITDRFQDKMS